MDYEVSHLQALEAEAMHIFREVAAETERPVLLFSGGKDSVVLLHLARPEIARHEDQRLLEIDGRVVAQPQRRLVEHAEQQPSQTRRRLLDLIEEHY